MPDFCQLRLHSGRSEWCWRDTEAASSSEATASSSEAHDDDTYEWTYVGAYARSESASSYLENKIRYLNRQKYDMFNENCQYYSKAVAEECIRDEDRGNLAVV